MAFGVGGGGFMGVAFETTYGSFVAPTKYFPFTSESLHHAQGTVWRRPIRKNVDVLGGVAGNVHVEGDVEIEVIEDVALYFHMASRATVVKAGVTNFTYTFTPSDLATPPNKSLSITIVRNGIVYGYTGMVVGSFSYTIDEGMLKATYSMTGSDEAVQSLPTPTFSTVVPFGAGQYNLQIPTSTQVFDMESFELQVEDGIEPQFRAKNTGRGAQFMKYGERAVSLSTERDFDSRTDYDAYKALTAQSITLIATKGANNSITFTLPSSIKDTYEVNLSGQGDLVRASISYVVAYDASTSKSYGLVIATQEDIVV